MRSTRQTAGLAVVLAAVAIAATGLAAAADSTAAAFLNKPAPEFKLPDAAGKMHALADYRSGKGTVLIWVSIQCPVSNAYNVRMSALAKEYTAKGFNFIGINSNKAEASAEIAAHAKEHGLAFPILKDDGNVVADLYGASVTPEVYLIDPSGVLRYHGRIDDSMKDAEVTTRDLKSVLDAVLAGQPIAKAESKAFGCTIKRVGKAGA